MAKKMAKKSGGKTSSKAASKSLAKSKAPSKPKSKAKAPSRAQSRSAQAKPPVKTAAPAKLTGMQPISTGGGASAAEIGAAVVAHLNSGAHDDTPLWNRHWSKDFASIEGMGVNLAWYGREAVREKCQSWMDEHIVHGCRAEGPFVGSTGFCVHITMDVEERKTGNRRTMREVGVYTVQDGKVVREEFMYA